MSVIKISTEERCNLSKALRSVCLNDHTHYGWPKTPGNVHRYVHGFFKSDRVALAVAPKS
jgi:hypothetical protein